MRDIVSSATTASATAAANDRRNQNEAQQCLKYTLEFENCHPVPTFVNEFSDIMPAKS